MEMIEKEAKMDEVVIGQKKGKEKMVVVGHKVINNLKWVRLSKTTGRKKTRRRKALKSNFPTFYHIL